MRAIIVILICCFYSIQSANAHQDTIIKRAANGALSGLPEQYQPAILSLDESFLQIGSNKIIFPPCIAKYFPSQGEYEVGITASWYHGPMSGLPPYISIKIHPQGKDYSYGLLIDLDTVKPIELKIIIKETKSSTAYHTIEIDKNCESSLKKSVQKAP